MVPKRALLQKSDFGPALSLATVLKTWSFSAFLHPNPQVIKKNIGHISTISELEKDLTVIFIRKQNHSAQICHVFFCHNKKKLSAWTSSGCFPRSLRSWLKELGAQGLDLIELGSKSGPKSRESRGDFVGFGKLEVWAPGPIQRILREVLIKYLFFWGGRRGGGKIQVIYKGLWEFPTFWDIDFSTTRGEVDFFRRRWGPKFLMNPQNLWTWHFFPENGYLSWNCWEWNGVNMLTGKPPF